MNNITWRNHHWALAILMAIVSIWLILAQMSSAPYMLSVLYFVPKIIKLLMILSLVIAIIYLLVAHIFFKKRNKSLELTCFVIIGFLFLIAIIDRVVLVVASDIITAINAPSQKGLGFLTTMFYVIRKNYKSFFRGITHTLELALVGTVVGFLIALLLVFCRIQKPDKRDKEFIQALKLFGNQFATFYVTIIRGTPMMVQGLIVYYAGFRIFRALFPNMTVSELNGIYSVFLASAITVSLNTAAYICEVIRGSVEAIDKGQNEAARSLGLTSWQTLRKVVFPQAIRNSIPAICNEFIINIKDTSVMNVVGMSELMFMTTTIAGTYYIYLETYMITAIIYLILTIALQAIMNIFAKKMDLAVQHGVPSSN